MFVDETDFQAIYQEVQTLIRRLNLEKNCQLVRERSSDAISYFERESIEFGLIHIDGNHDSDRVEADVALYLPRLIRGGFVVMDDISWDSVRPAYEAVANRLHELYERLDKWNDYAVFWDAPSSMQLVSCVRD